jgi:hypothetical protein
MLFGIVACIVAAIAMMAWTGDYMSVINQIMLADPMDDILGDATVRLPWWHRITSVGSQQEYYGKYKKGVMQTLYNYNASPREELDDVVLPLTDQFAEVKFGVYQVMSSIGWTQEEAEDAVKGGADAVIDLVQRKVQRAPIDIRRKLNYFLATDGTGRLGRVSGYNAGTVTVDNTKADFGWDLLQWIYNGMLIDIFTVADITGTGAWTTKATRVRVSSVNNAAGTFTITAVSNYGGSSIAAPPADGDFVFVTNSVKLDTANKFARFAVPYGKMLLLDDGSSAGYEFNAGGGAGVGYNGCWYGKDIYGLDRTQYEQMMCQMWRASQWAAGGVNGTPSICSVAQIQEIIRLLDEDSEAGSLISALYMNGKTRDWLARTAAAEHNGFTNITSGKITPGIVCDGFRTATGRMVDVVPMVGMPDGHMDFVCEEDLIRLEKVPVGWHMLDGKKVFTPPGARNLTQESWMRTRFNTVGLSWMHAHMEDIDVTA